MLRLALLFSLALLGGLYSSPSPATPVPEHLKKVRQERCEDALTPQGIFEVDIAHPDLVFTGFTPDGHQRLLKAQKSLREVTVSFNNVFESMESFLDTYTVAMASGHNVMSLGGPGGAKSATLLWLISNLWVKQVHEMLTDLAILGGQTEEGIRKGREELNTKGSILETAFAMLDEVNNANPQLLATLLSVMNPGERFIYVSGKRIMSKLRSVFTTGNATRYELIQTFIDRGMQSGEAYLARSLFKQLIPNWLDPDQQERRDEVTARRNRLRSIARMGTREGRAAALAAMKPQQTTDVDWDVVDAFAEIGFVPSLELEVAARDMANTMRKRMHEEIKNSERILTENPGAAGVVFTPSADWNERMRSEILRIIKYSAAIDYLRVATEAELSLARLNKPIELGPLSLWRAFSVATTVGPGLTRFNPKSMTIEWNLIRKGDGTWAEPDQRALLAETKDLRTQLEFEHLFLEQRIFNEVILDIFTRARDQAKEVALLLNEDPEMALMNMSDLERLIFQRKYGRR